MQSRITVIMGIFNCENTLPEALDSLYAQTYKAFNIILCDDGSTDNTYEIAKSHSEKFDNILLIKNEKNKGLSFSLNHCLKYANTEFIARMDGDDVSLPTRFEKEINFLDTHPEISIISTSIVYFDENGDYKYGKVIEYPQVKDFLKGSPFCHAPCMVRKKAYTAVSGYSDDIIRDQDYHLWFKMYSLGFRGYNLKEALYKMRDDRNATMRRKFKYRVTEMHIRLKGFKMLGLPFYYQIYAFKPIFIGLLPKFIYSLLHRMN